MMIARYTGGVPVILYDHPDLWRGDYPLPPWIPEFARNIINSLPVKEYQRLGKNIWRHVKYQAQGKPSGTHGLFHRCVPLKLPLYYVHVPLGIESTPLLSSGYPLEDPMGSIRSGSQFSIEIAWHNVDIPLPERLNRPCGQRTISSKDFMPRSSSTFSAHLPDSSNFLITYHHPSSSAWQCHLAD